MKIKKSSFKQAFETTVFEPESNVEIRYITIPARSLDRGVRIHDVRLEEIIQNEPIHQVARFILDPGQRRDFNDQIYTYVNHMFNHVTEFTLKQFENVEGSDYLVGYDAGKFIIGASVVPFENSPLQAESVEDILTKAAKSGAVTLGTAVGYMIAGRTPFLLLCVPAGIVICGIGTSFTKWFDEHRDEIFGNLMRPKRRPKKTKPK